MANKINWEHYLSEERIRKSSYKPSNTQENPDKRNEFEKDLGRVIFSSAVRRMHDKTQVMPLTGDDNVHTRLTHSTEVMCLAHSFAINICRNKKFIELHKNDKEGFTAPELEQKISAILETAALMHDIGNPPFGHFGEKITQRFFRQFFNDNLSLSLTEDQKIDFTEFDGNAQGFRVITKLQYLNDINGLNLTCGTLGAYMKYPNIGPKESKEIYIGRKKHGVYTSERFHFDAVKKHCNLCIKKDKHCKRHPLSFLVEAADTIAYLCMDIEDGWANKFYSYPTLIDEITDYVEDKKLKEQIKKHSNQKDTPDRKQIVDFRVWAIQHLVTNATNEFLENMEKIENGTYTKELTDGDTLAKALGKFTAKHIFTERSIRRAEMTGATVLNGLYSILTDSLFNENSLYGEHAYSIFSKTILRAALHEGNPQQFGDCNESEKNKGQHMLESDILQCLEMHLKKDVSSSTEIISSRKTGDSDKMLLTNYNKLRIIVDFVSGMTDQYAVKLYQQLKAGKME